MEENFTQKEEHILKVALDVFLEKGLHGTKMQEIADRAGVNKAMLHYYFRSKERLYAMIFEKLFLKFMNAMADSFRPEQNFAATLRHFVGTFIDSMRENPRLPLFVARELSWGGATVQKIMHDLVEQKAVKSPQIMIDELRKAERRGEIRAGLSPIQFIFTLIGACVYPFVARPIAEALFPDLLDDWDTLIEQRKEAVFDLLYNGLKK
jgi:TetR/AcrR family transcriptional regulator